MSKLSSCLALGLALALVSLANAGVLKNNFNDVENFVIREDALQATLDMVLDDNMDIIRNGLVPMDPTKMPDMPIRKKGALTNGNLYNLSKVKRTGECRMKYEDKKLTITLKLGWEDLYFNYDYAFKLWFIQRRGTLKAGVDSLTIDTVVEIDFRKLEISLVKVHFNFGRIELKLNGSVGDKLRSIVGKIILNLAKKPLTAAIDKIVFKVLTDFFNVINNLLPNPQQQFKFIDLVDLQHRNNFTEEINYEITNYKVIN